MRKRILRKIRERGGTSYKLFWTDVRGKRKERRLNRMKDEEGRIVEEEDEVWDVMARYWEELVRSSEEKIVTDTVAIDVQGCELSV